jgi:hypothetical protein
MSLNLWKGNLSSIIQVLHTTKAFEFGIKSYELRESTISWNWSSSCSRQSVDQFVWISGLPLGPLTRFYLALLSSSDNCFILLSKAPSLTRKRVCSLQCNRSVVRLLMPNNHTLPFHLRLCSLFVASYDSQGLRWKYSNLPPHGVPSAAFDVSLFIWCVACN